MVKQVAQGHRASKCWSWDLNPGNLIHPPSPSPLPCTPCTWGVYGGLLATVAGGKTSPLGPSFPRYGKEGKLDALSPFQVLGLCGRLAVLPPSWALPVDTPV